MMIFRRIEGNDDGSRFWFIVDAFSAALDRVGISQARAYGTLILSNAGVPNCEAKASE